MSQSLSQNRRVRLSVESLDSREMPSAFTLGVRPPSQAQTVQAREASRRTFTRNTIHPFGYSGGSTNIIGILVAL